MFVKLQAMLDAGFTHTQATNLMMAAMTDERSHAGNILLVASAPSVSSSAPARVATSRVVNASNVIVKKQKLFLTNDESAAAT
jgi:hypothetical protein